MAQVKIYSTPTYLYRYRSLLDETIDRELKALEDAFIYCPRFSDMNDPMEGAHRLSLGSVLRGRREGLEDVAEARNDLGIASLSEVHDHEPMWAHYAGQFSGICIMYSTRKLLAGLDDDIDLIRMAYNETPPILASQSATLIDKAKLTLATKTLRWTTEREWRIIAPMVGKAEYSNPNAVMRVYLGSRIEDRHEDLVRKRLRKINIPIAKMKIDKYAIEFTAASK